MVKAIAVFETKKTFIILPARKGQKPGPV